jgi:CxxC motif-containing protein (DUF1111 family)
MGRRIGRSRDWHVCSRPASLVGVLLWGFAVLGVGPWTGGLRAADTTKPSQAEQQGRDLFEREWLPGDSRTHGGDGLGPVFNDSSCIACHNLGGTGGGGPASKNVDIITASSNGIMRQGFNTDSPVEPSFLGKALGSLIGLDTPENSKRKPFNPKPVVRSSGRRKVDTGPLVQAHAGFRTARSVVLHRFSTESGYEAWRQGMLGFGGFVPQGMDSRGMAMVQAQTAVNMGRQVTQNSIGQFVLVRSQRNPTALFGAGLIDSIPDRAIEEAAHVRHPGFPEITGRVSRLKDKRIGRFGWKAQTASLPDFVLTACAVELGLEVPGHHQGGIPQKPAAKAKGLDLTAQECDALVTYVRELPKPLERHPATASESKEIAAGRAAFATIGCATCHSPKLGGVEGIYSDLLLHDLGPQLGDTGQYGVFDPSSSEEEITDDAGPIADAAPGIPAGLQEATTALLAPAPPPAGNRVANAVVVPEPTVVMVRTPAGNAIRRPTSGPASRFEWRTPPLWGFRDSGPYLHDGRADILDQAVALHGGEAAGIAQRYFGLSPVQRRQVEAFLKSLTAPDQASVDRVASAK